jgi:hypothetical protein
MNVRGHTNSGLWMYAVCWLRQVTLIQFSERIFWTNCVHSWYGVGVTAYIHGTELMWLRKVMVRSWCVHCVHCILYSKIHLADFMFLLYIAQSRQSSRLFLQSSELGLPRPLNRRSVSPPPLVRGGGGGAHFPAGEGVTLWSWCDRVKWPYGVKKICIKWLWPVKVTLTVIKRPPKIFCWSCDGVPLKLNKKNCRASSLSLRIKWAHSHLSFRMIGQYLNASGFYFLLFEDTFI